MEKRRDKYVPHVLVVGHVTLHFSWWHSKAKYCVNETKCMFVNSGGSK